ncbi:MAG: isopenicillin N synthase-like dioxygenase [Bacillariaceae sp.]|jgi:isopenicillin N synthase-like dioxygenase
MAVVVVEESYRRRRRRRRRRHLKLGLFFIVVMVAVGMVTTMTTSVLAFQPALGVVTNRYHNMESDQRRHWLGMVATTTATVTETTTATVTETTTTATSNNEIELLEKAIADLSSSSSSLSLEEEDDDNDDVDDTAKVETTKSKPKTHFELYENQINDRVLQSEKVEAPKVVSNSDDTGDNDDNNRQLQLQLLQPDIVSWKYLQELLNMDDHDHSSSTSKNKNQLLFELYRQFENTGGYMIVELDNENDQVDSDRSIVEDMWSTMEEFFSLDTASKMVDKQIVGIKNGGYNFIRTYMNRQGYILPETIQETLERIGGMNTNTNDNNNNNQYDNGIKGSNELFATMAKTVGILTMAGSSSSSSSTIPFCNKIISSLLDDKQQQFVNAEHRLSQYIINDNGQEEESKSKQSKESLRSHTDWTITTCIPLSSIPGLQIYKPKTNEWIIPEHILKGKDRTKYVIVMAGNWIELITNQKIISCVHRVVNPTSSSSNNSNRRLSAPYFLRPKRYIFDMMQEVFNNSNNNENENENENNDTNNNNGDDSLHWKPTTLITQKQQQQQDLDITASATDTAIDEMCYIFDMYIQFMKGNRNPNIPDYLFDIYINNDDDDEPKCYTLEDILL